MCLLVRETKKKSMQCSQGRWVIMQLLDPKLLQEPSSPFPGHAALSSSTQIRAIWTLTYITDPEHSGVLQRDFNHWIQMNKIWTIDPDQEHLYHESDQSVVPIFPIFTTLGSRAFLASPPLDQNGADDYQLIISWT